MSVTYSKRSTGPLVVAGMHRSGTSLLASMLVGAGVHMGDALLSASPSNPRGHFEDREFVELHQQILRDNREPRTGYTTAELTVSADHREIAAALLTRRRADARPWGWKDPRTTLFLDFWLDLAPDARFVLPFRRPWEVADSLYRRGGATVTAGPVLALELWLHYNRVMLAFAERRPERICVVDVAQLSTDAGGTFARFREELGADYLGVPPRLFDPAILRSPDATPHAVLVAREFPEVMRVYKALCARAGNTPVNVAVDGEPSADVDRDRLCREWAKASRAGSAAAAVRDARVRSLRSRARALVTRLWR